MILGVASTVGALVDPDFGAMLPYLVFLAVLAVRPHGLFPKKIAL
jgi:branched-chain amino acid transport system permease protein